MFTLKMQGALWPGVTHVNEDARVTRESCLPPLKMTETARKRTRTVEQPEYGNIDKCTCFVRRVPKDVGENELLEVFGAIGPVKKAFIVQDKDEERHKGYAFVNFALPDDAKKAVRELANHSLHGSKLKVRMAVSTSF